MNKAKTDVLIVGSGVAGLYCALHIPEEKNVTIITKARLEECDSYLAQGGICVLKDDGDYKAWYGDTLHAGHYENNPQAVDLMIRSSQSIISDLAGYGVRFAVDEFGKYKFTREGAHSTARILYHEDIIGKEITSHLLDEVKKRPNITLHENITMLDILIGQYPDGSDCCRGIIATCEPGTPLALYAEAMTNNGKCLFPFEATEVVWACGGIGGLFPHTTNYPHLTGDALGIALAHGIPLQDPDYIQFHPTALYSPKPGRAFLISESVRGEGGILLDKNGNRFTDELQPRDKLTEAIKKQMQKDGTDYVWLSMEKISPYEVKTHFKNIYQHCKDLGYDCTQEAIPVVPAQHYFMGGVYVDMNSLTSLKALYAIGETSCNGVHGRNRLASNSLIETLVFSRRAAQHISKQLYGEGTVPVKTWPVDYTHYKDTAALFADYKFKINMEIERFRRQR
ncbi:MAG: FAD-binding protein [Treponema sp.]|nr:FAD-binding protein [Treponema sp.]